MASFGRWAVGILFLAAEPLTAVARRGLLLKARGSGEPYVPTIQEEKQELIGHQAELRKHVFEAKQEAANDNAKAVANEGLNDLEKAGIFADKLENDNVVLTDLVKETAKYSTAAVKNSLTAEGLVKLLKKNKKKWVEQAKKRAREKVVTKLRKMYHDLDAWKTQVLRDPWQEAQVAAKKAAEPYYKNVEHLYSRIHEYELGASTAAAESASLASGAQALAGTAQGAMAAGDVINAQQDEATAHMMAARSGDLKGQATTLHGQAQAMQGVISQYLAHAHMAAWRASYEANPEGYPPPPHDVDADFLPNLSGAA